MMKRSICTFLALLLALTVVFGGGASAEAAEKVLRIGTYMAVTTLVPWRTTSDGDGYILRQIYQPLLGMNAKSEFVPNAAESWSVSEDGKTWTFKIREDLYWQTGNDLYGDEKVNLTAEDVKFSYEFFLKPENQSVRYKDLSSTIKEINIKDKYTVEFVTNDIDVLFEYKMYMSYIIPKKAIETGWDLNAHPVGSGAYKFVEHVVDTHVILEKNKDFWKEPALDRIEYKIITDKSVSAIALQNDEIDISLAILPTEAENIANADNLELRKSAFGSLRWVGFNCKDPLFTDVEVRRALRRAIDIDGAIKTIFQNNAGVELARRAYSCVSYERPGGDTDGSAQAQWESFDPKAAAARLDELGWKVGADGVRAKDGKKMKFTLQVGNNDANRERLAVIVSTQLRAIGVDCTAQTAEWGTHTEDIRQGRLAMYILGGYSNLDGPKRIMETNETVFSPNCGYSNPKIDELLAKAWVTLDYEARCAIIRECAAIFAHDAAHIASYFEYNLTGVNKRVKDFEYASIYHPLCAPDRNVTVE